MRKRSRVLLFVAFCLARPLSANSPSAASSPPMNEFTGTVEAVDTDAHTLQLEIEGGYNVEFSFDSKTLMTDAGRAIQPSDLQYGDKVTARYVGKELYAKQIVRNPSAIAAQAVAVASSSTTTSSIVSSASATTP